MLVVDCPFEPLLEGCRALKYLWLRALPHVPMCNNLQNLSALADTGKNPIDNTDFSSWNSTPKNNPV